MVIGNNPVGGGEAMKLSFTLSEVLRNVSADLYGYSQGKPGIGMREDIDRLRDLITAGIYEDREVEIFFERHNWTDAALREKEPQ